MGFHHWRSPVRIWAKLKPRAREFRGDATRAEAVLWERLRGRRLQGYRFRRQHAMGRFVVDFICPPAGLVVEVDGPIHTERADLDAERDRHLAAYGLRIVRVRNREVLDEMDAVLERIAAALASPSAHRLPPTQALSPFAERWFGGEVPAAGGLDDNNERLGAGFPP